MGNIECCEHELPRRRVARRARGGALVAEGRARATGSPRPATSTRCDRGPRSPRWRSPWPSAWRATGSCNASTCRSDRPGRRSRTSCRTAAASVSKRVTPSCPSATQADLLELRHRPRGGLDPGREHGRQLAPATDLSALWHELDASSWTDRRRASSGRRTTWRSSPWRGCDRTPSPRRPAIDSSRPYAPQLNGFVPGFGKFSPCPWGLGPEVRGDKHHWMGDWPPASFGHFGKSGALLLLNADEQIGLVATSTETVRRVGHEALADLDECDANAGPWFVSPSSLRVGLDLDGSLESLGNSMTDLADALDRTGECDLVRFRSRTSARTKNETHLALRALWSPLWRRSLGRSIDGLLPPVDVVHVAGTRHAADAVEVAAHRLGRRPAAAARRDPNTPAHRPTATRRRSAARRWSPRVAARVTRSSASWAWRAVASSSCRRRCRASTRRTTARTSSSTSRASTNCSSRSRRS